MHPIRRNQRQRPQHKGIFQDFSTRQHQSIEITHQIAIQQHVDIQRQTFAIRGITTVVRLDEFQTAIKLYQWQVRVGRDHKIEERPALDAHRLALEHRRTTDIHQERGQRIETGAQMGFTLDIATEPEVDLSQRHPRSISTPTPPLAAGTAPGLVSFSRTQVILNSAISTSTRRSAKVSTSWNCACSAKA